MKCYINPKRDLGRIDPMIYGHFIEHFHRQIYGGVYDPASPFADEDGLRADVLEAMRQMKVPVLRWPGGCFVSSYHWKKAVGKNRTPFFDKAWRVEDPNTFGTDEYIKFCRKIDCAPYICTNAGTGTMEEMSDWVEYCNLKDQGEYAKQRVENGFDEPHAVKYWSIGNENYGDWEIGAKDADEWSRLVLESAKMMKHADPTIELSAAALTDPNWNLKLLQKAGKFLDWISIHAYYDGLQNTLEYAPSDYETMMSRTGKIKASISKVRGTLMMLGLEKKIKITYDEWNPRGWHHPGMHTNLGYGLENDEYLKVRDRNDTNSTYTMADAVFTACFLNECIRNCDIVKMANFAPLVNTCGPIFTYDGGIVKRTTFFVFELLANRMGDVAVDLWTDETPEEIMAGQTVQTVDLAAAYRTCDGALTVSAVNKSADAAQDLEIPLPTGYSSATVYALNGPSKDSYNDIGREEVFVTETKGSCVHGTATVSLAPHSVNLIVLD